ncbi:YggS family pyridoxal phosphate-dependent enzyme [Gluconobacter wancherniae]|uniref:Pyridoxal phosphate homeostasis protein n=1 Tax=Gluconobacter wancherniae NBRC 103581 TaxID=656744 RepID=A0A511AYV7_9PROT|nr:YggS family pyridoxal phosphate-dependent enzyme [Gluconobacter wancherniae]MBF0852665.1 YggS family pyridoxal phosphate-dependent enzyme [Gluconobacter wancherniae]MBS1061991.1 YggS family pyridoxal phosphate-dependent enzyme [Gluconobacter wancherniae]MBS1087553.1 YggS family pyridoxal phosphate-dependent enzyme [Gluconobacter wancherniae]MBS1093235.1 YggS family pyridoxal phosphate-dependent enzyme [Gluconobacter wancherniae]GBD56623.1 YggS family pyridoxal phosphate enzyme [Gluconobacte
MSEQIASNLSAIRHRMIQAAEKAGRNADDVSLVAVSKFHPQEAVEAALKAGQRLFGENRVQEAASKFPQLRENWPDLKLHIIGGLQTNKAVDACRIADMIESLDRPALSNAIEKASQKCGRLPGLLVQVNTGDETQKSGIPRKDADAFIETSMNRFGDNIRGLMCIPPESEDPVAHFNFLNDMARRHGLPVLSMGMSADFEAAIGAGATLVRVGSAIFGSRPMTVS